MQCRHNPRTMPSAVLLHRAASRSKQAETARDRRGRAGRQAGRHPSSFSASGLLRRRAEVGKEKDLMWMEPSEYSRFTT